MKIFIASDHAGFELKKKLVEFLSHSKYEVEDRGPYQFNQFDDYPDYMKPAAEAVAADSGARGIVIGGSGEGEAMVANRVRGVRAAVYYGGALDVVKLARDHNDANVLSLGARLVTEREARDAVTLFLSTPFSNDERHVRRIAKIDH
ncbi:MAG: RpiB/LacA/LacB family sugar-phosphate isomerase [bacterium]|nr:RpiB/LacA/LacB family sugar-phosphate isomerase [bacterium]